MSDNGKAWLYAISETNREGVESWHDGEQCVFGDRQSAQDEVDLLNDEYPEGEFPFKVVPLYRAAALAEKPAERPQPTTPTKSTFRRVMGCFAEAVNAAAPPVPQAEPDVEPPTCEEHYDCRVCSDYNDWRERKVRREAEREWKVRLQKITDSWCDDVARLEAMAKNVETIERAAFEKAAQVALTPASWKKQIPPNHGVANITVAGRYIAEAIRKLAQ